MSTNAFFPADILLPCGDMKKWACVACDQFSSDRAYWDDVCAIVGDAPSTYKLIVPEAYLGDNDTDVRAVAISDEMAKYLSDGTLTEYKDSFVYVERTVSNGKIRRGIVGKLDLEQYDYSPDSTTPVRASEGTIEARLPARVEVRRSALIELPHIMALISDKNGNIIENLAENSASLPVLYDFDLMKNGGHICGRLVSGENAEKLKAQFEALAAGSPVEVIMGDGNHSLAAAKKLWNEIKLSLSESEKEAHPARFALVEINNVYDDAIEFEAIHRCVFGVDTAKFVEGFKAQNGKGAYTVSVETADCSADIAVDAPSIGALIGKVQDYIDTYIKANGGEVDYIHGEAEVRALGKGSGCVALVLPSMGKDDFFDTVIAGGVFPRKSFSIGHANEKRYYLEGRKIK